MTIILREQTVLTEVIATDPAEPDLRVGMRLAHAILPRTIDQDRRFVACLSVRDWNGVRLSGIESPSDIEKASALLRVVEANRNIPEGALLILAVLDTARAALSLQAFHRPIPRLSGYIFDADALAKASGAAADSDLLGDLRLRLPLAARACGVTAFLTTADDSPETSAEAARNGYGGICLKGA